MKVDKYTFVIIFGTLAFISLIVMWKINVDYAGGPFGLLALIFTIATIISLFYPKKK